MDILNATEAFSALSQEMRLKVFRLLMQAGDTGMAAGEIASKMDVRQNTMSNHLAILTRAGLVRNKRDGRSIIYYPNFNGLRDVLEFLMEDCCGGNPAQCKPILDQLTDKNRSRSDAL